MSSLFVPDDYSALQDATQSIVDASGRYDFLWYSRNEAETIGAAFRAVHKKYRPEHRAIGLANEAEAVLYKARYILFEVLIQRYRESEKPIDRLAVAFAYASQGARSRRNSIIFFEKALPHIDVAEFDMFLAFSPLGLFNKVSSLYEQEHEWDNAIKYLLISEKYCDVESLYYKTHLQELEAKKQENKPIRNRKRSASDIAFAENLEKAAAAFVRTSGL